MGDESGTVNDEVESAGGASRGRLGGVPLWLLLSLAGAVFAMAIAAVATLAAGRSFVGEAVVVLEQPGVSYSADQGLENAQMLATLAPTLSEWARSDEVLEGVADAVDFDGSLRDLRTHVSATVLPDTLAIRLRTEFDDEALALAGVEALSKSFVERVETVTASDAPPVDAQIVRAPATFDNRPGVLRSVVVAGVLGVLLGLVASAVLERS